MILEMDSVKIIEVIQANENEQLFSTVKRAIKDFLKRSWMICVRHKFREGNEVVNVFVKMTFSISFGKSYLHAITGVFISIITRWLNWRESILFNLFFYLITFILKKNLQSIHFFYVSSQKKKKGSLTMQKDIIIINWNGKDLLVVFNACCRGKVRSWAWTIFLLDCWPFVSGVYNYIIPQLEFYI